MEGKYAAQSRGKPPVKFHLHPNLLRRAAAYVEASGKLPPLDDLLDTDIQYEAEVFRMIDLKRALIGK